MQADAKVNRKRKADENQVLLDILKHNFNNSLDRIDEMKKLKNQRPFYYKFVAPWICLDSDIPQRSDRSTWGFDLNGEILDVQDEAISDAVLLMRAMNDPEGERIRTYDGISSEST